MDENQGCLSTLPGRMQLPDNKGAMSIQSPLHPISMFDKDRSRTYLGHQINLSATSEEEHVNMIISEFQDCMAKTDLVPLPVAAKLQVIGVMATPKLHFYFPNIIFSDSVLDSIEESIVIHVRSWLRLNESSARSFMFSPRREGGGGGGREGGAGLGLFHPRSMYYAKKLSFMLSALHSDDEQTRHTARSSLTLHLTKRQIPISTRGRHRSELGGYQTGDDSKLIKVSKVTWRMSPWIHLNELCAKPDVQLHLTSHQVYTIRYSSTSPAISCTPSCTAPPHQP